MPNNALQDWPRTHFKPGGGDPFLFYVIFGAISNASPLSRSKYRCNGIPESIEVMRYGPNQHPEVPLSFQEGYLWAELLRENPVLATAIASQTECTVIRGNIPDPSDLNYLRDTIGLITYFLDCGGVAVYDPQSFKWWSSGEWNAHIFMPSAPVPTHHVVILTSEDQDSTEWLHTRGLRKFGRPDLSIHQVTPAQKPMVIDLFNRFIEMQAFGAVVPEGQPIRMQNLPSGMHCTLAGNLDDLDFNNEHIEILW